jgi:hypothetical protein
MTRGDLEQRTDGFRAKRPWNREGGAVSSPNRFLILTSLSGAVKEMKRRCNAVKEQYGHHDAGDREEIETVWVKTRF